MSSEMEGMFGGGMDRGDTSPSDYRRNFPSLEPFLETQPQEEERGAARPSGEGPQFGHLGDNTTRLPFPAHAHQEEAAGYSQPSDVTSKLRD
jgi:hypothetical protein